MQIIEVDHPLKEHYLSILRDKNTTSENFRIYAEKLSFILLLEGSKNITLKEKRIETPLTETTGYEIENDIVAVAVLRAGLGLVDGIKNLIPSTAIGYIGVQRNEETANPEYYYENLPDLKNKNVFILEPMLATGGSLAFAIEKIKEFNPKNIIALTVICAPEGLEKIKKDHPEITLVTAKIDQNLNENWYIVPGLGDMGDRLFGTT